MQPILPDTLRGQSADYQQRQAEEATIFNADTSHLDHKRVEIYIDHIKAETEKAYRCIIGHWRGSSQREAWVPKSQIEFTISRKHALIPVWLAKRIGVTITIKMPVVD